MRDADSLTQFNDHASRIAWIVASRTPGSRFIDHQTSFCDFIMFIFNIQISFRDLPLCSDGGRRRKSPGNFRRLGAARLEFTLSRTRFRRSPGVYCAVVLAALRDFFSSLTVFIRVLFPHKYQSLLHYQSHNQ